MTRSGRSSRARLPPLSLAVVLALSCAARGPERRVAPGGPVDFPLPPVPSAHPTPTLTVVAEPAAPDAGGPRTLPAATATGIDDAVATALAAHKLPGCVVVVGRHDRVLFERAYGSRSVEPTVTPMTLDTVFDLASLTKPVATASSVLVLADQGRVDLDAPLGKYLPELGARGVATLRQALTHTAGFLADTPYADYDGGADEAVRRIALHALRYPPGSDTRYSDVGFLLLGEVVRRVTGKDLAAFAREAVFAPLGMTETGFLPGPELRLRAAPTENVDGRWLTGEVHDPRARLLGGVAGHAGVFSTPHDLTLFAQAMLGAPGPAFLSPRSLRAFAAPHDVPRAVRALGWDVRSAYSANRGTALSPRAFGHGGYTGTSLWIDPEKDLFILFLSNRVHPSGHGEINPLAGAIADLAAAAVAPDERPVPSCPASPLHGQTETGLDVLARDGFARLAGRRVGLITNASGVSRDGKHDKDSPRVGARREARRDLRAGARPRDRPGRPRRRWPRRGDRAPRLQPLWRSLLPHRRAARGHRHARLQSPRRGHALLHLRLDAAPRPRHRREARPPLRRPRPPRPARRRARRGADALGPPLVREPRAAPCPPRDDDGRARAALRCGGPPRHGARGRPPSRLGAAGALGETGLAWRPPSPNLRTADEALLYPGVGLLEATNLSVGRGTSSPFELVGAPWVDGTKLAAALASHSFPGVRIEPATFTPEASRFRGQLCSGLRLTVTDPAAVAPVALGIALAVALHRLYPATWELAQLAPLLGSPAALEAIRRGADADAVVGTWLAELAKFDAEREKYLLYPRKCP